MKALLLADSSRQCDQKLINEFHIPGLTLMQRASHGMYEVLKRHLEDACRVLVVCGPGNNGGDGSFLASYLQRDGYSADIFPCFSGHFPKGDALTAYETATSAGCRILDKEPELSGYFCICDALYGTGLSRELSEEQQQLLDRMNEADAFKAAVDIPSGIDATTGQVLGSCFHADLTVTFHYEKVGQILTPGRKYCGELVSVPIAEEYPTEADALLIEKEDIAALLPPRPMDSHKGRNGFGLLFAGSSRYTGAALLSARACMRGGCGITTVCVPSAVKPAFKAVPEVIAVKCGDGDGWDEGCIRDALLEMDKKTAFAVGPGMGKIANAELLKTVLETKKPTVLDADGLNDLALRPELYALLHEQVVITPHPGEMARLCGKSVKEITADPVSTAKEFALKYGCIVLLKGATTCITDGREVRLNITGGPSLSKGGSGDVLTGLTLALLCQGLKPIDAASAASYLFGASAEVAFDLLRERMLGAYDLTDAITKEISSVRGC